MPKQRRNNRQQSEAHASSSVSPRGGGKSTVSSSAKKSRSGVSRAGIGKRPSSSSSSPSSSRRPATAKGKSPMAKKRKFSGGAWTEDEEERLQEAIQSHTSPYDWQEISKYVETKTPTQCKSKNQKMMYKDGKTSKGEALEGWNDISFAGSGPVPHKANNTRVKNAKPATASVSKSATALKKGRAGGKHSVSNAKTYSATQKKKTQQRPETSTSIGRASTSTTKATTKLTEQQGELQTSIRKVSTTKRTKEGRALKRKPAASPGGSTSSSVDGTRAEDVSPSFTSTYAASSTTESNSKGPRKKKGHSGGNKKSARRASGKWTDEESRLFDEAVGLFGRGDWSAISKHVGSRTPAQCKSHNQKMVLKEEKERIRNEGSQRETKKTIEASVRKPKAPPAEVSTSTTPSRTVSPSPSPTTAHADAAAVLFSMRG